MKKKFCILIIVVLFLNIIPAYSEVKFLDIDYNGKKYIYYSKDNSYSKFEKDKKSVPLEILTKNIPLQSSLRKDYELYYCSIKNNSQENIDFYVSNAEEPKKTVKYIRYKNPRFPSVYLLIPNSLMRAKDDFTDLYTVNNGLVFIYGICDGFYNVCIKFPFSIGQSIWYTLASPYYYVHDKNDSLLMQQDLTVFNKDVNNGHNIITANEEKIFYILKRKANELSFSVKLEDNQNFYFCPQYQYKQPVVIKGN